MNHPLVSVCIPCHNAEPYVGQAIESILAQSWPRIEIIVVDDGSTDGSAEALRRHSSPQLHVISDSLGSAARSRNLALASAQGEWIKFFDADDLLHPEAIERQVMRLADRTDAVASSDWGRFYGDDISSFTPNPQSVWRDMNALDWLVESWRYAQPMTQPGMFLIPRALLENAGGWDEQLGLNDDFEFFARVLCHAETVLFTDNATLYYRSGLRNSLSQQRSREAYESSYYSLLKATNHLLGKRADSDARRSCANILQNFIYEVYPSNHDLVSSMEARIEQLGGADLAFTAGPRLAFVAGLAGWRTAKLLKYISSMTKLWPLEYIHLAMHLSIPLQRLCRQQRVTI